MRKLAIILSLIFIAGIAILINYEQPVNEKKQITRVQNDYRTRTGCGYNLYSAAFTALMNVYVGPDEVMTSYSIYVDWNGKYCFRALIECMP